MSIKWVIIVVIATWVGTFLLFRLVYFLIFAYDALNRADALGDWNAYEFETMKRDVNVLSTRLSQIERQSKPKQRTRQGTHE